MYFTRNEYLSRMKKTQLAMSERGIDLLLVTDPANMCYLSGHDAWSFYVHQGVIVTLTDEMPIFVGRYMDAFSGVVKTTWLDEAHVRAYSDTLVQNPDHHPMERFAEIIKELGAEEKTIALEMDNYWFTAKAFETLKAELPKAKLVDGNLLVNWIRIIKSDQEIEYQRKAGKLAELAITAASEKIEAGARQCDVVAAIYYAQIHGTEEFGGDYPSIVPMLPAGEMAGAPHLTWSDERYPDNTVIAIEIAGCYRRYHSPLARTVCIGSPNPKVTDVAKIAVEGLEAALGTIKPGIYLEEAEFAFRSVLKKYGLEKEARIGYSMGLNYPPDWGEHTASIRKGDKTILQPNMTFHCIPGMYFDNFGVSISEAFRVTETGCETFANYSRELIMKQIIPPLWFDRKGMERMNNINDNTPLFDAIVRYIEQNPSYFRIPGHRGAKGINRKWVEAVGEEIFRFDLTETPLLDDLHNPEGAIKAAEELAARVFGSDKSYFLVNGTTCGNQAMVLTAAVEGEKLAIPRNAHKSALMGLIISGAEPIYLRPELSEEWGIQGGIKPETVAKMYEKNPNCKGVMVVSPSYYGLCSDLKAIAEICHKNNSLLMVDEAHGAHLYFTDKIAPGALEQGADLCAQSIHKVTGSLTQSSMLHVKSDRVNIPFLEANLHIVQSTSPSYLLMTSLDLARHDLALHGRTMISNAIELAEFARNRINQIKGMVCAGSELAGIAGIKQVDLTRLVISAKGIGLTGFELKSILFESYGIDVELSDYINILAIVTFANEKEDMERLVAALADIAVRYDRGAPIKNEIFLPDLPTYVMSPRKAYFAKKRAIPWSEARGQVAGEMIAPYPPGIPVIYPGELLTDDVWEYVEEYRRLGRHLHGPADHDLLTFQVISDQ